MKSQEIPTWYNEFYERAPVATEVAWTITQAINLEIGLGRPMVSFAQKTLHLTFRKKSQWLSIEASDSGTAELHAQDDEAGTWGAQDWQNSTTTLSDKILWVFSPTTQTNKDNQNDNQ